MVFWEEIWTQESITEMKGVSVSILYCPLKNGHLNYQTSPIQILLQASQIPLAHSQTGKGDYCETSSDTSRPKWQNKNTSLFLNKRKDLWTIFIWFQFQSHSNTINTSIVHGKSWHAIKQIMGNKMKLKTRKNRTEYTSITDKQQQKKWK